MADQRWCWSRRTLVVFKRVEQKLIIRNFSNISYRVRDEIVSRINELLIIINTKYANYSDHVVMWFTRERKSYSNGYAKILVYTIGEKQTVTPPPPEVGEFDRGYCLSVILQPWSRYLTTTGVTVQKSFDRSRKAEKPTNSDRSV